MKEKTIKVLKVEPMKAPTVTHLKNDLKSLQEAVDGLIEIIPLGKGVAILDNEEAKLRNMQGNRRFFNDIIAGTFYIVGDDDKGNLCSLTEEQIAYYNAVFLEPEVISDEDVASSVCFKILFD